MNPNIKNFEKRLKIKIKNKSLSIMKDLNFWEIG